MGNPHITIDFETSHLVFPALVGGLLAILFLAILVTHRRAILASGQTWGAILGGTDRLRFLGTIVLLVIYFMSMEPVGNLWPNTGLGFLICSIPFVLLIGLLYLHDFAARSVLPLVLTAVIVPAICWYVFAKLFFLTLP